MIDEKGRCCGRKPLYYKGHHSWRNARRMLFCDRCCREYDPDSHEQRENFHWMLNDGRWAYTFSAALGEANMAPVWGDSAP